MVQTRQGVRSTKPKQKVVKVETIVEEEEEKAEEE